VAEFFDVTLPTVEAWIRKGCPVVERGSRGIAWTMDLRAVAEWLYGGQQAGAHNDPDAMAPQDRKAWFDSESRRVDLEERARKLIPYEEVVQTFSTGLAALRQDIMAIPDALERADGAAPDVADAVERRLHAALAAMSGRFEQFVQKGPKQ
jgi:hypothetical protein